MNEKERQIISHLRRDARISLTSISNNINMPISTVYDKINRLHKGKVIKRYIALVDFLKLGYHHHAKLAMRVPHKQKGELLLFLRNHKAVNSLHEINSDFDFLVEVIHKNIKEHNLFLEELQECFDINEIQEFQIINEIEKEKFE